MRKAFEWALTFVLAAGMTTALMAQGAAPAGKAAGDRPAGVVVDSVQVTTVVKAVDTAKRTVTLGLPDGTDQTFKVSKKVVNFDQVKVGDQVKATYVEALAVSVRGPGDPPAAEESGTVALAPKGAKPGVFLADTQTIAAKVTYINHETRMVTLTGPQGNGFSFKVGPNVTRLDEVKQGDDVTVSYTEGLIVDVQGAKA